MKKEEVEVKKVEVKVEDGVVVEWTQEEQTKLQKALKQFPAKMDPMERWTNISETVGGGKTKKDCLNRVKEIKAKLQ